MKVLLETPALRHYFLLESVGSTMDNLHSDIVLSAPVLIPPLQVQVLIVDRVRRMTADHVQAIDRLDRQTTLLRERRQALITAAVTGEMAVPGTA